MVFSSRIFACGLRLTRYIGGNKTPTIHMKPIARILTAAVAAILTITGTTGESQAAKVRLDGSGYYEFEPTINYYSNGVRQTGRYGNLGRDYYRKTTYSMRWITNHSGSRSGDLSFEFWGMPYYGADSGIVLMTRGLNPLNGGSYYPKLSRKGYAIYLDEYRFPELNLWEYTRSGWRFRDALSFSRDNLL